ncbi:MAG TPA: nuclear transport factor 2 family protein [Candidatus Acidoferrum sp.]|jgi:ketosteroid isomerase-like protein|nr:nuclear transport factor 2 family protein [Candidatus Acidoferrum sp.]
MLPRPLKDALDAFSAGNLQDAAGCFSEDAVYRELRRPAMIGRAAIADHFAAFAASGTAWRFVVEEVIIDSDRACVTYLFSVGGGTGQPMRERAGCAIVHLDGRGQIAEWREYEG